MSPQILRNLKGACSQHALLAESSPGAPTNGFSSGALVPAACVGKVWLGACRVIRLEGMGYSQYVPNILNGHGLLIWDFMGDYTQFQEGHLCPLFQGPLKA